MKMYLLAALLMQLAVSADAHTVRNEIEGFLATGIGNVVFIILLLLSLLWLLLPLAIFGLKSRLKKLIRETRQTNELLTEIRNELASVASEDTADDTGKLTAKVTDNYATKDLYEEIRFEP